MSELQAILPDNGPSAQMYGSLAAVLAGFAFIGLVLYLGRQNAHPVEAGRGADDGHIEPKFIVKTLFYAMSSLMTCAFLYAHLASKGHPPHQAMLGLSLSGLVLGPGVLSLFYALNLVMVNHTVSKVAAEEGHGFETVLTDEGRVLLRKVWRQQHGDLCRLFFDRLGDEDLAAAIGTPAWTCTPRSGEHGGTEALAASRHANRNPGPMRSGV